MHIHPFPLLPLIIISSHVNVHLTSPTSNLSPSPTSIFHLMYPIFDLPSFPLSIFVGFCTWDAFYSSVDSDKVSAGLDSLSNAGVTVKYVILDDGWQSTALSGKGRDEIERSGKKGQEKMGEAQKNNLLSVKIDNLESVPGSALLQSDLLLLDAKGILRNSISPDIAFTSTSLSGEPVGEDGELSGAQIDGNLAAQKMLEKESSPIIAFLTQVI